jgi:Contractile injection system tube protein/LysM domain
MAYEKAIISILDVQGKTVRNVSVLINPFEYTLEKENEFASIGIPGSQSPLLQFTRGGLETLSMELFFDSYEERGDVRRHTDQITNLLKIDGSINAPPVIRFIWGTLSFTCVLKRASRKFTLFLPDGTPVRSTMNVTFQKYGINREAADNRSGSPNKTRVHTVSEGDSLWSLSARFYGSSGLWRLIAEKNEIGDPLKLKPGTQITIPPANSNR